MDGQDGRIQGMDYDGVVGFSGIPLISAHFDSFEYDVGRVVGVQLGVDWAGFDGDFSGFGGQVRGFGDCQDGD